MAATTTTTAAKSLPHLLLLLLVFASFYVSFSGGSPNRIRAAKIPSCCDMSSESQCSQNPRCRWCRSESLDDMCFPKSEALRLPPQVFTCKLIRFNQKF